MKTLLAKFTSDEEIINRLFELYPDQVKNKEGYQITLMLLRKKKPRYTDFSIEVSTQEDWFDKEKYTDVVGKKDGDDTRWALDSSTFSEWLGFTISPKSFEEFSELDVLCHCLWEMTWHGYTDEEIGKHRKYLNDTVKKIERDLDKKE